MTSCNAQIHGETKALWLVTVTCLWETQRVSQRRWEVEFPVSNFPLTSCPATDIYCRCLAINSPWPTRWYSWPLFKKKIKSQGRWNGSLRLGNFYGAVPLLALNKCWACLEYFSIYKKGSRPVLFLFSCVRFLHFCQSFKVSVWSCDWFWESTWTSPSCGYL